MAGSVGRRREGWMRKEAMKRARATAAAGIDSHVVALAQSFLRGDDLFGAKLDDPGFDGALASQAVRLRRTLGDQEAAFRCALREIACVVETPCAFEDSTQGVARLRVFAVELEGGGKEISTFLDDDGAFDGFAKTFKACGMADPKAVLALARRFIPFEAAAKTGPGALRARASDLLGSLLPLDPAKIGDALDLLASELGGVKAGDPWWAGAEDPVSGILVGARASISFEDEDEPLDFLTELVPVALLDDREETFDDLFGGVPGGGGDAAGGGGGQEDGEGIGDGNGDGNLAAGDWEEEHPEIALWTATAFEAVFPGADPDVETACVGLPDTLDGAVASAAFGALVERLDEARKAAGVPDDAVADVAAAEVRGADILVTLDFGGVRVGPARVPAAVSVCLEDGVRGLVETLAESVVVRGLGRNGR